MYTKDLGKSALPNCHEQEKIVMKNLSVVLIGVCFLTLAACSGGQITSPLRGDVDAAGALSPVAPVTAVRVAPTVALLSSTDVWEEDEHTPEPDTGWELHVQDAETFASKEDMGPPPEDVPPPEVEAVGTIPTADPKLCAKIAEVEGKLEGEGEFWPADWHHPGCSGSAAPITRLPELEQISVEISVGATPSEETTETCVQGISWYEEHACVSPYLDLLFPELTAHLPPGEKPWKPVLVQAYAPEPKSPQELHDILVAALKMKDMLPLFTKGAKVTVSTFVSYGKGLRAQVVIEHPLLGRWTGTFLVPMGKIRGVVLAIHGHEIGGFMGPDGLMRWLEGFGMDDYPEDGIAVLLMASRPYMGIGYQGVETFEPKLAFDLWNLANVPLASVLVIEHLLELEVLRHLEWTDEDGGFHTTAGVPIAYIGHSGGGHIAQVLAMVQAPTAGVIADYPYSPTNPWPFHVHGAGTGAPHCEDIPQAGDGENGGVKAAMNGKHGWFDYQRLFASDEQYYFHHELIPGGHYLPPWELAVRRQVLLTMLGIIPSPDVILRGG